MPGSLESTLSEIEGAGGRAVAVPCDHADDDDVEALFSRLLDEQGGLDLLVNNAFRVAPTMDARIPFWKTPVADWDDLIDVGTRSAYVCTHHAAKTMSAAAVASSSTSARLAQCGSSTTSSTASERLPLTASPRMRPVR